MLETLLECLADHAFVFSRSACENQFPLLILSLSGGSGWGLALALMSMETLYGTKPFDFVELYDTFEFVDAGLDL